MGDGAGHRPFRDAVLPQERRDVRIPVEGRESAHRTVAVPFTGCPAPADRDVVLVQGPQHLVTVVSKSAAISVADHSRSRCLRCSLLVLGWTEMPAVFSQVRTVSLLVWC